MPTLTIAWEYLTGYAVATDPSTRDRAEWPPHPARVFMALAAAWFETEPPEGRDEGRGEWASEGEALRWLEGLGDPEMILPAVDPGSERATVTFYVPVNDRAGPSAAALQSCPSLARGKQPRTFPRRWVGYAPCIFHWPDVEGFDQHAAALDRLCRKVTRLGHSSSLVRMWLADHPEPERSGWEYFVDDDRLPDTQVRSLCKGTLDMLGERFGEEARRQHSNLSQRLEDLKSAKKTVTGRNAKGRKAEIDRQIAQLGAELESVVTHPPVRPTIGLWSGYRRVDRRPTPPDVSRGHFDHDIVILAQTGGPALPLVSTLAVTRALRETVMSQSGVQPVPDWVSGHLQDGRPLRDGNGHLACVPLPHVGYEHANGHLLGVGLVFPRRVSPRDRGLVLGAVLVDPSGASKAVNLNLGRLGRWEVRKRDWSETRKGLQADRWTAFPHGALTWASVSPVVLDRFPKADHSDPGQRPKWEDEVRQIIRDSCARSGLPDPELVDVDTTSWHLGSPRAVAKRRPLRGPGGHGAVIGDGFPPHPLKGTNAPRPQVHVWLQFPGPVIGPVLLGAGRYLGYGLCKPWQKGAR